MTQPAPSSPVPPVCLGTVVAVADDHVGVRVDGLGSLRAEVATDPPPRAGDRVVLASVGTGRAFVIGVLRGSRPKVESSETSHAAPERARWVLPEGDLELFAAAGKVVLKGRDGVTIESEGDVSVDAAGAVSLSSGEGRSGLRLDGDVAELRAGLLAAKAARLRVLAEELEAVAELADSKIERARLRFDILETQAGKIVQTARTVLVKVEDVAETRAGRLRFSAEGAFQTIAKRARFVAREVFHIDGERIHLG